MSKIRLLDDTITGRIAAGEVVERPASIVKELVENSMDANASAIAVGIEEGGIREIRITDNGDGILPEDMPLAVVKHATSKIYSLSDLNHIASMGFRGEALASIAAVSMLTIKSRPKGRESGTELYSKGGKVAYIREAGLPEGTTVCVENLFYNTPARLKFLKKPGSEAAIISDMVLRLILARPDISIKYSANGKVIFHSPGDDSLLSAISSIYGYEIKQRVFPVDFALNGIHVSGYIGSPNWTYKSQKYGSVYINKRYVKSQVIQTAVMHAYGERLLKGNFPLYVLNIDMDYSDVDVNVHPNKLSVHFSDENAIQYVVMNAISDALTANTTSPVLPVGGESENRQEEKCNSASKAPEPVWSSKEELETAVSEVLERSETQKSAVAFRETYLSYQPKTEKKLTESFHYQPHSQPIEEAVEQPLLINQLPEYRIVGVAFSSYVIVESAESLYFIDQHAGHERILYNKIRSRESARLITQKRLIPERVSVSPEEKQLLEDNTDVLLQLGFEIQASEQNPLVYEVLQTPQILGEVKVQDMLQDLVSALEKPQGDFLLRLDRFAKSACKQAVKAGQRLSAQDIETLVREIQTLNTIPNCPHGRPIAIEVSKMDLEKGFKRRV